MSDRIAAFGRAVTEEQHSIVFKIGQIRLMINDICLNITKYIYKCYYFVYINYKNYKTLYIIEII